MFLTANCGPSDEDGDNDDALLQGKFDLDAHGIILFSEPRLLLAYPDPVWTNDCENDFCVQKRSVDIITKICSEWNAIDVHEDAGGSISDIGNGGPAWQKSAASDRDAG
jgi:hypothetical protein